MVTGLGDGVNAFSATLGRFIGVIGKILQPALDMANVFGLIDDKVSILGHTLYEKQYASNFLEGIIKLANAFSTLALGVVETLNPFNSIVKLVDSVGNIFSTVLQSISSFFTAITDPSAAENVAKIAEAITAIPTKKNIEFVSSMGALAATNTAAGAVGAVTTTANIISEFVGGESKNQNTKMVSAAATPYEVTINVMLDRDKLATVVEQINGQQAKKAIQGIQ